VFILDPLTFFDGFVKFHHGTLDVVLKVGWVHTITAFSRRTPGADAQQTRASPIDKGSQNGCPYRSDFINFN